MNRTFSPSPFAAKMQAIIQHNVPESCGIHAESDNVCDAAYVTPSPSITYLSSVHNNRLLRICAWCPNADVRTREAEAHGWRVTHTLCPRCEARVMREG